MSTKPNEVPWFAGGLELELDPHTGLAKWPLSFKRIEKDTKRPNKTGHAPTPVPKGNDQPPTAA